MAITNDGILKGIFEAIIQGLTSFCIFRLIDIVRNQWFLASLAKLISVNLKMDFTASRKGLEFFLGMVVKIFRKK